MSEIRLASIVVYPLKGAGGCAIDEAEVGVRGLRHDRRLMLVDGDGVCISQRETPALSRVGTAIDPDGVRLWWGADSRLVPFAPEGAPMRVRVWDDTVQAVDAGDRPARWLGERLGRPLRVVYMPDSTRRQADTDYAPVGHVVSFADGFPLLLATEASLADLNKRLKKRVSMDRFRPNLVLHGAEPFAEDDWGRIQIGEVELELVKPCARCVVTTIDQETGEPRGPEPLATLASYRKWQGKAVFGENAVVLREGTVRLGDELRMQTLGKTTLTDGD